MVVTLVCAVASISLVVAGLRALQKNGLQRGEAGFSLLCAACGIALWPTSTALATDRLFGVPGVAHVLADNLILLTFALQFRFTRVLSNAWTLRMQVLFYGAIGLVALHAVLWGFDEMTVPGDHRTLWYNHYYGRPL